jgi:hypothetical protein
MYCLVCGMIKRITELEREIHKLMVLLILVFVV